MKIPLVPAAAAAALCFVLPSSAQLGSPDEVPAALREQEALADDRERRLAATLGVLEGRERAALEETRRIEEGQREASGREQHLAARGERIPSRGVPTQRQGELEAQEARLAEQDRNLGAQARSLGAAIDAALGRERSAASREDAERDEERRLAASAGAGTPPGLETRRQALGARTRRLAAGEARVSATSERLDALESQLRIERERLEVRARRLDALEERLDVLEQRLSQPAPRGSPPEEAEAGPAPRRGKAAFATIVRAPTALVRERPAAPAVADADPALHPGLAVDKAVAAAAVVTFATPASQLAELDRETIAGIAKLAGQERCELLIWARASDRRLVAEAQRRAAEIRTAVVATGLLSERQVVVRITTRPGPELVDVVVSALRDGAVRGDPAPAPARGGAQALQGGEAGKRQIREAVQSVRASIEACLAEEMEQRRLARAEGVLKLAVTAAGRVGKVASNGDLSGTATRECLGEASRSWAFPPADAGYAADVPIAVIRSAPSP